MSEEPTEEPKLIIDDDWKERVQSEKEAAAASIAANKDETPDAEAQKGTPQDDAQATPELPPASFATLVHSLTAQALASLGQIPDAEGKTRIEIGLGKHFIDTLAVLEEKTKGNLTDEEVTEIKQLTSELQSRFVQIAQLVASQVQEGGVTPEPSSQTDTPTGIIDPTN